MADRAEAMRGLRNLKVLLGTDSPEVRGWAPAVQQAAQRAVNAAIVALGEPAGAPGSTDAERAAWLADKIVAGGDYAKEAAAMLRRWPTAGVTAAPAPAFKDPTDPGHDVEVLREHVRHLERRVRQLHEHLNAGAKVPEDILDLIRSWGDAYAGRRSTGLAPQELVDERWNRIVAALGVAIPLKPEGQGE